MSENRLYDRLGGRDGIRAVVDEFYDRLVEDEMLGPMFEDADLEHLRETQTLFLCEAAGGPETYEGPSVREAHRDVPLEPKHIWRTIAILSDSLDAFDVPASDADAVVEAIAAHEDDLLAPTGED